MHILMRYKTHRMKTAEGALRYFALSTNKKLLRLSPYLLITKRMNPANM
jgi:NADH:ubiquinone oxidoreductase subunit 2 (subunit N)